nr:RNA-directed DNA polymerase, eukaryota [Tanacetum cinerariifolium]
MSWIMILRISRNMQMWKEIAISKRFLKLSLRMYNLNLTRWMTVILDKNETQSEDPFKIYDLLNKKKQNTSGDSSSNGSMKYPLGFTPTDDDKTTSEVKKTSHSGKLMEDKEESIYSGHFRKAKIPRSGGSILQLIEEVVKVGEITGYNMEGCSENIEEIIGSLSESFSSSSSSTKSGIQPAIRVKVFLDHTFRGIPSMYTDWSLSTPFN